MTGQITALSNILLYGDIFLESVVRFIQDHHSSGLIDNEFHYVNLLFFADAGVLAFFTNF